MELEKIPGVEQYTSENTIAQSAISQLNARVDIENAVADED